MDVFFICICDGGDDERFRGLLAFLLFFPLKRFPIHIPVLALLCGNFLMVVEESAKKKAAIFSSAHSSTATWSSFSYPSCGRCLHFRTQCDFFAASSQSASSAFLLLIVVPFVFRRTKRFPFSAFLFAFHLAFKPSSIVADVAFSACFANIAKAFSKLGHSLNVARVGLKRRDGEFEHVDRHTAKQGHVCYGGRGRLFLVNIIFIFSSWLFLLVYPLAHGVCVSCIAFFLFFFHCDVRHLLS